MTEAYRIAAFDVLKQRAATPRQRRRSREPRAEPRPAPRGGVRRRRRVSPAADHKLRIRLSANSLHLTSVAPCIRRAKS